jgi:hypothetical protein
MIRIINELYDRREKKIINMAIDKSRTKSAIIDYTEIFDTPPNYCLYEQKVIDLSEM